MRIPIRRYSDASFAPPPDAVTPFDGVARRDQAAALCVVRGLLRCAPGDRWSLEDAVAALEVLLFVVLPVSARAAAAAAGPGAGTGAPPPRIDAAGVEGVLHGLARDVAWDAARPTVRAVLAADFLCSPRSRPGAVVEVLGRLWA